MMSMTPTSMISSIGLSSGAALSIGIEILIDLMMLI